jgi:hypothetical protein
MHVFFRYKPYIPVNARTRIPSRIGRTVGNTDNDIISAISQIIGNIKFKRGISVFPFSGLFTVYVYGRIHIYAFKTQKIFIVRFNAGDIEVLPVPAVA